MYDFFSRLKKRKDAPAIEGTFKSATKLDWVTTPTFEPSHTPASGEYVQGSWKGKTSRSALLFIPHLLTMAVFQITVVRS